MSAKDWDVVVIGGANTDYTIRGSQMPKPGETVVGDQFYIGHGGKGANQAVAAARLGARVAFVGRVGCDDRGEAMLAQLQAEGVDTQYVTCDPNNATGAAVIHVAASGEKQIFAAPNANAQLTAAEIRKAKVIQNTRVLAIQLEVPMDALLEATLLARESGAAIVLDPSPPKEIPDELLRRIRVIKPNSREAEKLTGIKVKDRESARRAADKLLARGVEAVAIQAGEDGNLLVWQGGEHWLPKIPVNSVDATGAGDAFAAGLAVMLAQGKSWEEVGHFASAAAALKTTKMGAQDGLPTRDAVQQLMMQSMAGKA